MSARYPPGPKSISPLGVTAQFRHDPLGFIMAMLRHYGDFVTLPGPFYQPGFLLNNPDLLQEVLVKQADKFQKPAIFKKILRSSFGNGLFLNEGDFWKRQRRLAQPAFHHKRIQAYAEVMVGHTQCMLDTWQTGQWCNIDEEMRDLTLQIVVDALFQVKITPAADAIRTAMAELGLAVTEQAMHPLKAMSPEWLPIVVNRRKAHAAAKLDAIVYRLIEERRRSGGDAGDLLSMFLLAVDEETGERMSNLQVRDEVMTMFIAGHETTALALTWTWVLLAQHPAVETKLHSELGQVLAGRLPTLADLANLPYTELIVKEVMRLYPPAWVMLRQSLTEIELGGYRIPKGAIVSITPYAVHRHPAYYDQPEQFWPERFAPDASGETLEKRLPRFAYFPFGGGPRICIGNSFAMMEARLLLATIAQRYCLQLPPGFQVEANPLATLGCKGRVPMQVNLH
ncbi:MAG: cytochrome P450 [Anaerolineae bacterium]|nr:cytochrome P450 [Anaerolineae bacterium]